MVVIGDLFPFGDLEQQTIQREVVLLGGFQRGSYTGSRLINGVGQKIDTDVAGQL